MCFPQRRFFGKQRMWERNGDFCKLSQICFTRSDRRPALKHVQLMPVTEQRRGIPALLPLPAPPYPLLWVFQTMSWLTVIIQIKSQLFWCHRCLIRPHFLLKCAHSWPSTLAIIAFDMERNKWVRKFNLTRFFRAECFVCSVKPQTSVMWMCITVSGAIHLCFLTLFFFNSCTN